MRGLPRPFPAPSWSVAMAALPVAALLIAANAQATAIYQYTGSFFDVIEDDTSLARTYTTSMRVTGQIELSAPLPANLSGYTSGGTVLSYSLSDGRNTLTEADSVLTLWIQTNSQGEIDEWWFRADKSFPDPLQAGDSSFGISTMNWLDPLGPLVVGDGAHVQVCTSVVEKPLGSITVRQCVAAVLDQGSVQSNPGSWTLIPEPSTALLLGAGLVALRLRRRVR